MFVTGARGKTSGRYLVELEVVMPEAVLVAPGFRLLGVLGVLGVFLGVSGV